MQYLTKQQTLILMRDYHCKILNKRAVKKVPKKNARVKNSRIFCIQKQPKPAR